MWPLPRDRESLLPLAPEAERVLKQTANADNPRDAQRHANELFSLGEIRFRLGEMQEAERIFDEVATEFLTLENPEGERSNRDWAAVSRFRQANAAASDGRFDDAVAVMDRLIEEFGGVPDLDIFSGGLESIALGLWLISLEEVQAFDRLYDASGTALARLNPVGSAQERLTYAKATKQRARAAAALGRSDEAIDLYEKAVTQFEAQDPALAGAEVLRTMSRLPPLLIEVGRTKEAASTLGQMLVLIVKRPKAAVRVYGPERVRRP